MDKLDNVYEKVRELSKDCNVEVKLPNSKTVNILEGTPLGTIFHPANYLNFVIAKERLPRDTKFFAEANFNLLKINKSESKKRTLKMNNKNNMQINLSIFCHVMEQSALITESGERLDSITLDCPKFKVVDFENEEVERDSVLLSAALLAMPERYRPNFDGTRIEIEELTNNMLQVNIYDDEDISGEDTHGMSTEFLRSTVTIAYVGE